MSQPETILVVDDAAQIRDFVADYVLRPNGYHVLMAENGEQALELARREHPDLIVSDIKMPGVTGLDLARTIQAEQPHVPIILITAEGSEAIAQQALRAGVADYFIKPFDPEELLDSIRRALAERRQDGLQAPATKPHTDLETEHRQLAAILNEMEDGVIVIDADERLILINHLARRVFGVGAADVKGQPLRDVIRNGQVLDLLNSSRQVSEIILDDGRTFNTHITAVPDVGRAIVLRDVTYLKEMDRVKSEFVATVAHDLRSPLTAILGYVGLLDKFGPVNEQQAEYIRQIRASVLSISALLSDLLELGNIESGLDAHKEPIQIGPLVQRVADDFRFQANTRRVALNAHVGPNLPPVWGNPTRLRQMMSNLVENAIKYTPDNGQVTVTAAAEEGFVVITVTDTGIGIPAVDQPFIFDRFFRAENAKDTYLGTGLGLSIVKSIVDHHSGRIWVDSRMGHGSTFTVMLPQHKRSDK